MLFTFVFCIGAAFQTINTHSLPAFYISRCVSGLGLGASTVVIPMFSSEMVPKELRGQIGSFFQLFFTFVRQVRPFRKPLLIVLVGHLYFVLDRLWCLLRKA